MRKRDKQLEELRGEIEKLTEENKAKDERLYAAARDVVDAKRESVDARARRAGRLDLAVAHRATRQESVGLRQRYEREAQQARLALQAEIRGATVEIREDRDAALKRLEHVESLLKAQGGSENKQFVATKAGQQGADEARRERQHVAEERKGRVQPSYCGPEEGDRETAEGPQEGYPTAEGEQSRQAVLKARRKSALEEARKPLVPRGGLAVAVVSARMR